MIEMTVTRWVLTLSILFALASAMSTEDAEAASFNCRDAKTPVELTICQNDDLGILDERMATKYYALSQGLPAQTRSKLKSAQRSFLRARDRCGYNHSCLENIYKRRIAEMAKFPVPSTNKNITTVSQFNCHMGTCSWAIILKTGILSKNKEGILYSVDILTGTSLHDDEYPKSYNANVSVKWNETSNISGVYCNRKMPLVIYDDYVHLIDYRNVYGFQTWSANLLGVVCFKKEGMAWASEDVIARLGIQPLPQGELDPSMESKIVDWYRKALSASDSK